MGRVKSFYSDLIEQESRKINDSEHAYRMSEELKQYYFEENLNNLMLSKWQKLKIQFTAWTIQGLKHWRSRFISTILRIFRIG
jgi:hypothetical protein